MIEELDEFGFIAYALTITISLFLILGITGVISLDIASTVISAFLSLMLVFLYYRQTDIQEQQTKTLESQRDLMEANQSPKIDVMSIYPFDFDSQNRRDENSVVIELENVGKGVGTHPHLGIGGSVDHDEIDIATVYQQMPVKSEGVAGPYENLSSALKPGQSRTYHSPVPLYTEDEIDYPDNYIYQVVSKIYEEGATQLELDLSVRFSDLAGESNDFEILSLEIDLSEAEERFEEEEYQYMFSFRHLFREGTSQAWRRATEERQSRPWPDKTDLIIRGALIHGVRAEDGINGEEEGF